MVEVVVVEVVVVIVVDVVVVDGALLLLLEDELELTSVPKMHTSTQSKQP